MRLNLSRTFLHHLRISNVINLNNKMLHVSYFSRVHAHVLVESGSTLEHENQSARKNWTSMHMHVDVHRG